MRYRAEPASSRLTFPLGLMTLLYHRRSGITHMVSEPVPQILDTLDALGPADVATVVEHLRAAFDLQAEGGVETVIAEQLEELALLGLVIREPA